MKSAKEILQGARTLLSDPAHWTQGMFARTCSGAPIDVHSPRAACFCLIGAIHKVGGDQPDSARERLMAFRRLREILGGSPAYFNDYSTHEEVLALLDAAIAEVA